MKKPRRYRGALGRSREHSGRNPANNPIQFQQNNPLLSIGMIAAQYWAGRATSLLRAKSPVGSCGARNERLHQRAWSAKLQFGFYERWSPRDYASASRWQMPRSEGLPLRLDWTNSTRLTNVRDNRVGSLERKRLSRRRSPQPVGGSQGGIVRLWPRAHRDTVRRATATSHGTLAAAVTLQGCGTD
jgi:hypothetical protein